MIVNLIVLAVSLLIAGFLAVWIAMPALRPWMEMPKHRFLRVQRSLPTVARDTERGTTERSGFAARGQS
jgi:hypothetical protein